MNDDDLQTRASTQQQRELPADPRDWTAAERLAAGWGGSYTEDPKTGDVTLNEATAPGGCNNKHPDAPRTIDAE